MMKNERTLANMEKAFPYVREKRRYATHCETHCENHYCIFLYLFFVFFVYFMYITLF